MAVIRIVEGAHHRIHVRNNLLPDSGSAHVLADHPSAGFDHCEDGVDEVLFVGARFHVLANGIFVAPDVRSVLQGTGEVLEVIRHEVCEQQVVDVPEGHMQRGPLTAVPVVEHGDHLGGNDLLSKGSKGDSERLEALSRSTLSVFFPQVVHDLALVVRLSEELRLASLTPRAAPHSQAW